MNTSKIFTALFAVFTLALAIPTVVMAAPIEITTSIKSSLDKTIGAADRSQAAKISSLYNELLTLQKQEQDWDAKIKALHTGNGETLSLLSKQIKQIDAAKLEKLKADVEQTKEQYKPLFSRYSSLNKQIEAARMLKNKDLSSLLRFQANALKIPVQLARMTIKNKKNAWHVAKDNAAKTMKKLRAILADIDPVNVQIKAKKSAVKTTETGVAPVWSTFKQAVKKGDAKSVLSTFTSLVSLSRQINEEKQKIFNLETKISDILSITKAQMP